MALRNRRTRFACVYTVFIMVTAGFVGLMVFEDILEDIEIEGSPIIVDCNGGGNYTTIQSAINNANPGDTIRVWAGVYYENIEIDKPLTLIGNGTNNTTIDGGGNGDVVKINENSVTISGFEIINSGNIAWPNPDAGIEVNSANNVTITNNKCHNNKIGMFLNNSNVSKISNNTSSNNLFGILLSLSSNNILKENNVLNNSIAISIWESKTNTFINNTMVSSGIHIFGDKKEYWNTHKIDESNTVNGKPIFFWKNIDGGIVPFNAGQVILANCTNVIVDNQILNDGIFGIFLGFSSNNIISNNTCNFNDGGIQLQYSLNNMIINNTCKNSGYGIFIYASSNNLIDSNINSNNTNGILFSHSSLNNIITNNSFSYNSEGIVLLGSSKSNTISNNHISYNSKNGFFINYGCDNNQIYHNNIVSNTQQAVDNGTNHWNNNRHEGNYWSDYSGVDNGLNGRMEGDGIGDTLVPHLGLDLYPFVNASGWSTLKTPADNDDIPDSDPSQENENGTSDDEDDDPKWFCPLFLLITFIIICAIGYMKLRKRKSNWPPDSGVQL